MDNINLKSIEKKIWFANFQDGIWDIYWGILLLGFGLSPLLEELGIIKVNHMEYQDNDIFSLAIEYNDRNIQSKNTFLKVIIKKWFNKLENISQYEYVSAEVIIDDVANNNDNNTLPLNL